RWSSSASATRFGGGPRRRATRRSSTIDARATARASTVSKRPRPTADEHDRDADGSAPRLRRGRCSCRVRAYNPSAMDCPKCGNELGDEGRFCRTCGTDVGLVSRALTGQLSVEPAVQQLSHEAGRRLAKSITSSVTGLGFIAVAICVMLFAPAGHLWWFWML